MAAFTYQLTDVAKKGELVENSLGCTNDDPEKAIACMRSRGAKQVTTSVSNDLTMGGSGVIFGPNVDGYVLPGMGAIPFEVHGIPLDPQGRYTVRVHADVNHSGAVSKGDYVSMQSYPVESGQDRNPINIIARPVK